MRERKKRNGEKEKKHHIKIGRGSII